MAAFLNACRFIATAGGTTDWTYSSAITGYQSPAAAGVSNGRAYKYRAENADLSQWEIGEGTYNTSTGVLSRTSILSTSAGTSSKVNFFTAPQVAIVALKEDLISLDEANNFTLVQKIQARKNLGLDQTRFSTYLSTSLTVSNNTTTKIPFDVEVTDPFGWYDVSNFRFQPTVAGVYLISGSMQGLGTTVTNVFLDLYLNGAAYARDLNQMPGGATASGARVNKAVILNGTTDYVEMYGSITGTGTLQLLGGTAPLRSWFEAFLWG